MFAQTFPKTSSEILWDLILDLFANIASAFYRLIWDDDADQFAQTALVLPVMMLALMGLLDVTMASFAGVNADNAANYGARIGSVTQRGAAGAAYSGALTSISHAEVGDYVVNVSGGGHPGAQIVVAVGWEVPNHMASITTLWGGTAESRLSGRAEAHFRQEGW